MDPRIQIHVGSTCGRFDYLFRWYRRHSFIAAAGIRVVVAAGEAAGADQRPW